MRDGKGKCARSNRRRLHPQQTQRQQGRETERGRDDQDPAAHGVDQQVEQQRCRRLRHPRRRADQAEAIAIILRAEDRQRQRTARDGQDAVAGAVEDREYTGGPAARAGIKTGDVIVSIDGTTVDDPNSFDYRFATKPLGGNAQVALLRQGREMPVPVGLQSAPATPREEIEIRARSPFLGATVANLSPALADELRLDTQSHGVVIVKVADGSAAQSIGFRKGDIVISINNQKIEKSADLDRITRAGGRQWRITIRRHGQQISVMFSG